VPTAAENAMLAAINGDTAFQHLFPSQTLAETSASSCVKASGVTATIVDATLPPLTVTLPLAGGGSFSLALAPSQSYLYPAGGGQFCWAFSSSGKDPAIDGSLIGDTLLAGALTLFDIENQRVGFAPQSGCVEAAARTTPMIARPAPLHPWYASSPYFRAPPRRPHVAR
jgi:hypothetical protein